MQHLSEKIIHNQKLSIVIPCYNEEAVIVETFRRLQDLSKQIIELELELELIFVDDGSNDETLSLLKNFAKFDKRVKVISLTRNFGHQIAVTAGIDLANGDAVVLIDADLQDPPEVIGQMIEKWKQGYDVVYGLRSERSGESTFKIFSAYCFYRLLNKLSDTPIPVDAGDFRLMSQRVVNVLRCMPERDRFMRGMISWIGFKQIALPYKREGRFAGHSKYPLKKMLRFAVDGVMSFSTKPLKVSIALGVSSSLLALIGIIYALYLRIFTSIWVEGWTALMITILFLGGVQLISVGILGEYIGRIYVESKKRPLYIIDQYVGFAEDHLADSAKTQVS